ncbi:neuropilin-1-like [Branchiostoma floridae x Branchiostoma japonicum]
MTPYGSYVLLVVLMLENPALQGSMGQTCGGTLNRDSPTRNITSPDYPNPIQALITCDWIIEAPTGQVQLRFEEFSFFQTMRCTTSEPTVSIFDGSSISDPSLGRYCGNENGNLAPPDVTVSSSGSLLVHYYSGRYGGAGVAGEGFIATFSFPAVVDCASSPCTNGGTCVNRPDGFLCLCLPEYVGTRCEDTAGVDHCASSPCTNAGTCVNGPDSFQCLCPPEYVGTRCEDAAGVDHCASSPCTNVGTCVNGPDSFQCLCPPEYVGTLCQVSKSSCLLPLGMENGDIEDSQISASTEKTGYEAYKGRLNGPRAWQADVANTNQWLQVNLTTRTIITGIQTQGLWGGHVKSYRLLYGDTEDGLTMYKETGFNNSKIFDANSEGRTVVTSNFSLPILASILRVNPQDFTYNLIRLRVELLGCDDIDHCASSPCINGGTCLNVPDGFQCLCIPEYVGTRCQVSKSSCLLPLGMVSGYIEDSQISASTEKTGYEAYKGRLNGPRAWQANVANTNQWLQVNFNTRTIITGIQTQGLWGGHVKSYRLLYGDTEDGLTMYKETAANSSKVFDANSEGTAVVSHDLDAPILTSILRLNPRDFTNNLIRLRLELLGCEDVDHCASSPCTNGGTCVHLTDSYQCMCPPEYVGTQCQVSKASCMLALGMANGDIEDSQISASSEVAGYEAYKGRLNGPRAWEANVSNTNQWLQVNFSTRTIITGIQTQGLWGGHVKSYRLLYGHTEDGLSMYRETGSNSSKVFDANSDGTTVVTNGLDVPFITSILRVNPQDFKGTLIRLRMEVLGCEDVVPSASTQSAGLTTQSTYTTTALSTSRAVTTDDVSTVSQTTSTLSTTGGSSTQPTVTAASATTPPTILPSTQAESTEHSTASLSQSTSGLTTATIQVSTTSRTIAPQVETTTVIVGTTTVETTTVAPPTTPMVITTDTTTGAPPTTTETPAKPTTPKLETTATTKVTTLPPIATTVATRMVETSQTITLPTSVNKMTTGVSTTRTTNAPLLVKTTKPDDLIKTTKSSTPKHTTTAKDGNKEAQTGDSGGGGNTAVFAAAGAAGGVAVLVGVGVTVFICRRPKKNPEASSVPMQRLDASNTHNTDHSSTDVEIENPLYGAMDGINALGINVTDSSA